MPSEHISSIHSPVMQSMVPSMSLINVSDSPSTVSHPLQQNISHLKDQTHPASPSDITLSASSVPGPALVGISLQPTHLHSESGNPSPNCGKSEPSLPQRGPLNSNVTMDPLSRRRTSTNSEMSFISARNATPPTIPNTPLLLSVKLPNINLDTSQPAPHTENSSLSSRISTPAQAIYKPRTRKVRTKEVAPDNIHAVVALGMAPFMIGQDAIANQNRLVRNEAILTQHVLRLQRSLSQSESIHARREEDIYRTLQEHKTSINDIAAVDKNTDADDRTDGPARAPLSLRADPDFVALFEAYAEMRNRLDHLMADVVASTLSTKLSLEDLDERIRQLALNTPTTQVPPTPTPTPLLGDDTPLTRFKTRGSDSSERVPRKRKRDELYAGGTLRRAGPAYERRPSPLHNPPHGYWMETSRDGGNGRYADTDVDFEGYRDFWSPPIFAERLRIGGDESSGRRARLMDSPPTWSIEGDLEEQVPFK